MELFNKNSVSKDQDYLFLSRGLSNIQRSQTLPIKNKISVAEHILNSLFLYDFLRNNSYITPYPEKDLSIKIKEYLQYHDIEETIVGDIPYFTAKLVKTHSEEVRNTIAMRFGVDTSLIDSDMGSLVSQIDMLEFYLSVVQEDGFCDFDKERMAQVRFNAVEVMEHLYNNSYYKVDYRRLING